MSAGIASLAGVRTAEKLATMVMFSLLVAGLFDVNFWATFVTILVGYYMYEITEDGRR